MRDWNFFGRGRRAAWSMSLAGMLLPIVAAQPVGAGLSAVSFEAQLGSSCAGGTAPPSTEMVVRLRSAGGTLQGKGTVATNSEGHWFTCGFWDDTDPGDRIIASSVSFGSEQFVVPNLTLKVNRVSDVVSGKAPPNSSVAIEVLNCQAQCTVSVPGANAATSSSGSFSRDLTAQYNVRGVDIARVMWTSQEGDSVSSTQRVPWIYAPYDGSAVAGTTHPNALTSIELRSSGGALRGSFNDYGQPYNGSFFGTLRNSAGLPVNTAVGDKVKASFASDASVTVHNPALAGNASTNLVSGKCYPNRPFFLSAEDPQGARDPQWTEYFGTANSTGNFAVNINAAGSETGFELTAGDVLYVECHTAKGDILWSLGEAE